MNSSPSSLPKQQTRTPSKVLFTTPIKCKMDLFSSPTSFMTMSIHESPVSFMTMSIHESPVSFMTMSIHESPLSPESQLLLESFMTMSIHESQLLSPMTPIVKEIMTPESFMTPLFVEETSLSESFVDDIKPLLIAFEKEM
jgi:hypothetical protein